MFKLKKIIVFILLFFIFAFNINDFSYADSYVVALPEFPEKPNKFEYYFIRKIDNQYIFTWLKHTYTTIYQGKYYFTGEWVSYSWTVNNDTNEQNWSTPWGFTTGNSDNTVICSVDTSIQDCNIVFSNFDIKYNDVLLRSKLEYNAEILDTDDSPTLSGIGGFFNDLKTSLSSLLNNILTTITNGYNNLKNTFSNVGSSIVSAISNVIDNITSIPDIIISGLQNILEFLFLPTDSNLFYDVKELFEIKFQAFYEIGELLEEFKDVSLYEGTPHFSITYKNVEYDIIDFSYFDRYRHFIVSISSLLMISNTAFWLFKNVPNIIMCHSTDDNGEISTTISNH